LEFIELLFAHGAYVDPIIQPGYTPLYLAARWGNNVKAVELLIKQGASVNQQTNRNGDTALHGAATHGCVEAVKVLLKAGAHTGIKNNDGKTAYEQAVASGRKEVMRVLACSSKKKVNKNRRCRNR
jgi:ankyrin repeat protein